MFTGIIETIGVVQNIVEDGTNVHLTIATEMTKELKVDQSVSHNGVCLTVVDLLEGAYTVTAIYETMQKTNLGKLKVGDKVNLERAMLPSARLDGHFVQGHVDTTGICTEIKEVDGSWYFKFAFEPGEDVIVEKGSICVNGASLTLVDAGTDHFSVAIIPFTYEHTNFHTFEVGTHINLEFDIIGKYITKLFQKHLPHKN